MVGSLPPEIGNLKAVTQMDLSMNQFSNEIPREIGGLQNLAYLSLRHNKVQGTIPDSMRNMVVVFVPMTLVLLWIRYRRGKSVPQQSDLLSTIARERISYYELLRATNALSESNMIGSGSFGSVYKGILRSGTTIAITVFNLLLLDAAFKSFDTECEVLCSLRHRNLIKVITSCSNLDFKDLVLEYMPNRSLEKCSLVVIHCDIKPSNVLLDEDMVAHLRDFGISKLLGDNESDLYTKTLAALGYIAPEYGLDGLVSTKCDVYSYGIMSLEPFTMRKPNEFEGDHSLKQWVSYLFPEAVIDVVDANVLTSTGNRLQKELDVVASIMKVALDCCAESPARRTNMKDFVAMLQKIKIQLLEC
ncbi:putative CBL-interacting protein kinase 5-like isoform 1 [Capsicum annuum]|nr:putative CBL-interacting protein kinase 5-like isoform 1 [Capsicum annuum]